MGQDVKCNSKSISDKKIAANVYNYLASTYQLKKDQLKVIEPGIKSPTFSIDKVQSGSGHNLVEDKLIMYLDLKDEIETCERAIRVLDGRGYYILHKCYLDNKRDIEIARSQGWLRRRKDNYIEEPSQTYWDHKRHEAITFAKVFVFDHLNFFV